MRRVGLIAVVLLSASACWNFQGAYDDCVELGGRCNPNGIEAAPPPDAGIGTGDGGATTEDAGSDGGTPQASYDAGPPCTDKALCFREELRLTTPMLAIYGAPNGEVFAGGFNATMVRWKPEEGWGDGGVVKDAVYRVNNIVGTAHDDVWLSTWDTALSRWNGAAWSTVLNPAWSTITFRGLCGSSRTNYWALTSENDFWRFDGTNWAPHSMVTINGGYNALWCSDDELVMVGVDFGADNGGVVRTRTGQLNAPVHVGQYGLKSVAGSAEGELWAVGDYGTMVQRLDGGWTDHTPVASSDLNDVWYDALTDTWWAVGEYGTVLRRIPDAGWEEVAISAAYDSTDFYDVTGAPGGHLFIAGANGWSSATQEYDAGVVLRFRRGP